MTSTRVAATRWLQNRPWGPWAMFFRGFLKNPVMVGSVIPSSDTLVAGLQRIEAALGKSTTRSDEQLAYYVAQAREIIDLSITSQKDVLETLQSRATSAHEGAV